MLQLKRLLIGSLCFLGPLLMHVEGSETPLKSHPSAFDSSSFESLGDDLLEGLPLPQPPAEKKSSARTVPVPENSSPLAQVEYKMLEAKQLLSTQHNEIEAVVAQKQVVSELDKLISQLHQAQCKACSGGQPTPSPGSRRSQTAGKKPSSVSSQAQSAAQDSTDRLDPGQSVPAQVEMTDEAMKRLWGHLPERVREQLLQTPADEFLPKYRREIEKYFRRLAEEESK